MVDEGEEEIEFDSDKVAGVNNEELE